MKETKLIRQKYPNPKYMDITNSVNLGSFIKSIWKINSIKGVNFKRNIVSLNKKDESKVVNFFNLIMYSCI